MFKQLFNLCPLFSTGGWGALCSCCKWGFCSHHLRRRQRRSIITVSFHSEHAHRWGQHSLFLTFFLPKPPAKQITSVNSETDLCFYRIGLFVLTHKDKSKKVQIPLRWFSAWVDIACCSLMSPWLTVWRNEHVKFLTALKWFIVIKDAYHTIIMPTDTGLP